VLATPLKQIVAALWSLIRELSTSHRFKTMTFPTVYHAE